MGDKRKENSCWDVAEKVLNVAGKEMMHVLLFGPPGCGKSFAARTFGVDDGAQLCAVNLTEETAAFELRGVDRLSNGEFVFAPGPAIAAWTQGTRLVVEEIEKSSGDCLSFLLGILDDPSFATVTLPNGTTVRPKKGFHCVITANMDSPTELPAPVRDRLPVTVRIEEPHPNAIRSLPRDLRNIATNSHFSPDAERRHSVRYWSAFAKLREATNPEIAATAVFGESAKDILNALKLAE